MVEAALFGDERQQTKGVAVAAKECFYGGKKMVSGGSLDERFFCG